MISVIIITKNEANNIARCIQSVLWAQQIIVLDSGSEDQTVAIAKSLGAEVIETDWPGFGIQKQRALQKASQEWVLSLDADEYLAPNAHTQILTAIQRFPADAYRLNIPMVFQNKILKFAGFSQHIRLFKRQEARFSTDIVHEKVILPDTAVIRDCPANILHESYQDWSDATHKMNTYSSLSAKVSISKSNIFQASLAALWMLFRNLFLKAWILDGQMGFALAVYQAQGSWYRYLKRINPDQ